jgi:hypothetical protein
VQPGGWGGDRAGTRSPTIGAPRLETYFQDPEREGDQELAEFFHRAQTKRRTRAEQGKELLRKRICEPMSVAGLDIDATQVPPTPKTLTLAPARHELHLSAPRAGVVPLSSRRSPDGE